MKAYTDGSSSGLYGYILENRKRKIVRETALTSNQAEWLALLILLMDLENGEGVEVYSDSALLVNQFSGEWRTKDPQLRELREVAREIVRIKNLKVSLNWIPREENLFGRELDRILHREKRGRERLREKIERGYC